MHALHVVIAVLALPVCASFLGTNAKTQIRKGLRTLYASDALRKGDVVTVFGATGGVGQLVCKMLSNTGKYTVRAVTRNVNNAQQIPLLQGSQLCRIDVEDLSTFEAAVAGAAAVVCAQGTTALPTTKWKGGNIPKKACDDSVSDVLKAIQRTNSSARKLVLISSIGVNRSGQFPFVILNLFGVLDAKKSAEEQVKRSAIACGFEYSIVRPGRLVGAPFTNYDVARLMKVTRPESKHRVAMTAEDDVAGDVDRADVAMAVKMVLETDLGAPGVTFSMVNTEGAELTEEQWRQRLYSLAKAE